MKKRIFVFVAIIMVLACAFVACDNTPKVTFVAQNSAGEQVEMVLDDLSKVPTFTNGDKVFDGWYTDAACTEGNEWLPRTNVPESITVYAKWTDASNAQVKSVSVRIEGDKVTLQKDSATEAALKAQLTVVGTTEDDTTIVITDYTLQGFSASVVNRDQTVTVKYGDLTKTVTVCIVDNNVVDSAVLAEIFDAYKDNAAWNFQIKYKSVSDGYLDEKMLNYLNGDLQCIYDYDGTTYTEYYAYSEEQQAYLYYEDDGDGNYTVMDEDDVFYEIYVADAWCVDLTTLGKLKFLQGDDCYVAQNAQDAGDKILGEWEKCTWTSLSLYVANGKITKIVAVQEDVSEDYAGTYTYTLEFSKYGQISFKVPTIGDNNDNSDVPDDPIEATIAEALAVGKALAKDAETEAEYCITGVIGSITSTTYGNGKLVDATDSNVSIAIYGMYNSDGSLRYDKMGADAPKVGDTVTLVGKILNYKGTTIEIVDAKVISDAQGTTGKVIPTQTYNPATFDNDNLQDKMRGDEGYSIGLPSTGEYRALVVPVQFAGGDAITAADLAKLNKAFNGTSADTGWESVSSFYEKSSYGALKISFDIWGVNKGTAGTPYVSAKTASYYETYAKTAYDFEDEMYTQYGDEALLLEVLAYLYEQGVDLSDYDTNDDGAIDAVYLIYCAPVDYEDDESLWWAYVTMYYGTESYGEEENEVYPYYYLFAGFDFMDEDADSDDGYEYSGILDGLKINASTYIHETGHLLGLDDYYDYDTSKGSNKGLGGADMMDYTVGDHGVYSKIMLGWITPEIITTTQTFTIDLSDDNVNNNCVMLLLNSDNSYFCEYLLVDLYSATGLNQMHANQKDSYLYGGASFGARIYHVTNWCTDGFLDYNNSDTAYALIKLVEADGGNSKTTTDKGAWAAASDLWQTGDALSGAFSSYKRNDGKAVNFDISFDSVTATSATITVTFVTE